MVKKLNWEGMLLAGRRSEAEGDLLRDCPFD